MLGKNNLPEACAIVWIVSAHRSEVASLTRLLAVDFTVEIFEDGPGMLERLTCGAPPDVIVIEQRLPGPAALEICRAVRARPSPAELPILLLSAPVADEEIFRGLSAGADDYLITPFSPVLLSARIGSLVRVTRRRARVDETERAQLDERLRHRTELLAVGSDLGVALIRKGTLREALQGAAQVLVDHLDAAFARVWTLDEAADVLDLQASAGLYTHLDGPHRKVPVGQFKIGTIAATRTPHLTNAVVGDPLVPEQAWARREGLVSFAGYPLLVEDKLVGVLALFARKPLFEDTLKVLEAAARAIALVIEKERVDAALRRSQAWLAMTLESVGDALVATDDAGRVVFMNPVAIKLTGWTIEDAKGRPLEEVLDIVNETTRVRVENPVAKVLREGTIVGLANHTVLKSKDGSEVAIDDSAAPIRDEHGRLFGVVMVFRDVSEARRKDAELRTFRAVVEASTDFIAFGKPGGKPDYVNPAGLRLVGLASQEAASALSLADYYTPETRDTTLAKMIPLIRAGQSFHGRTELRHFETGEGIPVSQSAFAVSDEYGSPVVLATILRDQRDQRRAEVEREALLEAEKRARREATAERQKLHDLFMQAPVAISILEGPEHVFTLANPAYRAVVNGRDVVGKPLLVALPDIKGLGFDLLLDQVVATGKPFFGNEVEVKLSHHAEGEALFVNFVYTPKRDADGRIDGVLVSGTDVTEQVQARRAAESASAEFEAMFNSIPDAAFIGDAKGLRRANPAGLKMLGLSTVDSLRRPFDDLARDYRDREGATGESKAPGRSATARALDGEVVREESFIRNPITGQDIRLRSVASPIRVGGAIVSAIVIHADITEHHLAVEALQRSEESFRTLAEAIPQQVWASRPDGGLDFVNGRVLSYFASTQEKVLGDGWQNVIHPDDLPRVVVRWTHSLTTGAEYEVEFRLERADGTYRWHLGRAVAVRGAREEIVRWFGTNTDIDDAKRIREELEESTRFEQHLLGIVSHDLRNPLGAILLGATALLELEESDDVTSLARRIHTSAERSTRMIRDLLDFTQARRGGSIRLQRRSVDLHELAIVTILETKISYPGRVVELTREGSTQGVWDADRLAQVISNLVTNALKYSPPGTPVAVRVVDRGDAVELAVHNEGAPIPAERLGQIFAPLQRATDEIDLQTRSVGLGLYIVDAIVKSHDGAVSVVSTLETGTTFTVRLPR